MSKRKRIIVIDPGHGGNSKVGGSSPNNATGPNGLLEKNLTLDLSLKIRDYLAEYATVILTRESDINLSLAGRAKVAKDNNADAFISIHFNGFSDPAVDGTEVWVARDATQSSREFADVLLQRVQAVTQVRNRGVRKKNFGVLLSSRHDAQTRVCLLEVSFLTNPNQAKRLAGPDYLERLAKAVGTAIYDQLNLGQINKNSIGVGKSYSFPTDTFPAIHDDGIEGFEFDGLATVSPAGIQSFSSPLSTCDAFCPVNSAKTAGTKNFKLSEFRSHDGVDVPVNYRGNIQQLMNNLEVLRAELGGKPIKIVSGFRSCAHNKRIGGVKESKHLCGQAADIRVQDTTLAEIHAAIERLISSKRMVEGGLGFYNSFIHYDIRGKRARWDRRSTTPAQSYYAGAMGGTRPWSDFFHFKAGTKFVVDGPLTYNGTGEVLKLTSDTLAFRINMPKTSILGQEIPKSDLSIEATCTQEGPGNKARIILNGLTYNDKNVTIRTKGDRRRIIPSISIPGNTINEISLAKENADEIDLDVTVNSKHYDFDLERITSTASQLSQPGSFSKIFQNYGAAAGLKLVNITHAGPYRIAYDRLNKLGYGVIEPLPRLAKRTFSGQPSLQTALNSWSTFLPKIMSPPEYILTGGLYVPAGKKSSKSLHTKGVAIDVDGFWWNSNNVYLANTAPNDWSRYLRIEASLRKAFGTVLNYDYNRDHHDHWHCDLGRSKNWRAAKSQALFAQRSLNVFYNGSLTVDGKWGNSSKIAAQKYGFDFTKKGHWDRFLDNIINEICTTSSYHQSTAADNGKNGYRNIGYGNYLSI